MKRTVNIKFEYKRSISGLLILFMIALVFSCKPQAKESDQQPGEVNTVVYEIDKEAVEVFRKGMAYLSKQERFSVNVQGNLEDIHVSGHRVDYEIASSILVNRPDKFHTERHGDLYNQVFYYDGSTFTQYNPLEKVYATVAAPGTIEEMLHYARDTYGINAPAADLVYGNAFELLMDEVQHAEIIGKEIIGNVLCDHLLFIRPGVDFQIWIADDGNPLIYKYVVTDTATPELLAFTIVMRDWNISPEVAEGIFDFSAPQDAQKIEFLKVKQ